MVFALGIDLPVQAATAASATPLLTEDKKPKQDPVLKSIPVVAVTAFAMRGDEQKILAAGCDAYLSKPISVGKFIETIRHFLGPA